jgi:hypothetical protein
VHVDVGNVSAIVLTGTATSLDRSQDWPRSFTFRFTPMIVSDLPNHPDADEIRFTTVPRMQFSKRSSARNESC